ncbi:MAG: IPT/TIG domain-containing protein, partial [bacterium]
MALGIFGIGFFVFAKFFNTVRAQGVNVWGEENITQNALTETGLQTQDVRITIAKLIRVFLGFLGIIAVIIIIYSGYLWMTAGGNADQIETAKKWMRNAVIGLLIVLSSFAIASFVLLKLTGVAGIGGGDGNGGGADNLPFFYYSCVDPADAANFCLTQACKDSADSLRVTPYVCGISPINGPVGAYVTITGYHFGIYDEEKSKVEFYSAGGTKIAEIIVCPGNNSYNWIDNRIVVKVPELPAGAYSIKITNKDDHINATENQKVFKIIDSNKMPPGIACILPDEGKENTIVEIFGDYFGDKKGLSDVIFADEKAAGIKDEASWSMKKISVAVPSGAVSGNALIKTINESETGDVIEAQSNGYPFKVVCASSDECASGCCYKSSFCANLNYCVGQSCDNNKETSACEAGSCGKKMVCGSGSCSCELPGENDPCDNDLSSDGCQAGTCAEGFACAASSCACQSLPGPGENCNGGCGGNCKRGSICGDDCKCKLISEDEQTIIDWISPMDNNVPNGAGGNLITIHGKNFGVVDSLLENVLTNVDFSEGNIGNVPKDWSASSQIHTSVGISIDEYRTSSKSIKIHQDPNQEYPGACSKKMCDIMGCEWLSETNQCKFAKADECHPDAPAIYNEGQNFCWGNSNNVTWARLAYNISDLDWQVGEKYIIKFYYKGHTESEISARLSYSLGWTNQCASFNSVYGRQNCDEVNGESAGYPTCSEQNNYCCVNGPYQKKCYKDKGFPIVQAGTYDKWTEYSAILEYDEEMASHFNNKGELYNEIGLTIGYNTTGKSGTDFYVDDFTVAKVPNKGRVMFLGAVSKNDDDKLAIFPSDINPLCISSWKDNEIIAVVPNGTASGPIEVVAESGISDRTDDSKGPVIRDFEINNNIRPGLCAAYKSEGGSRAAEGKFEDKITIAGVNLGDIDKVSEVIFGSGSNGSNPVGQFTGGAILIEDVVIPNLAPALTTIFVKDGNNGNASNPVNFTILESLATPKITDFLPKAGHQGDYVTIYGKGFGAAQREVKFGDAAGDFLFPQECLASLWKDDRIIVKVPENLASGDYKLKVKINDIDELQSAENFYVGDYCSKDFK